MKKTIAFGALLFGASVVHAQPAPPTPAPSPGAPAPGTPAPGTPAPGTPAQSPEDAKKAEAKALYEQGLSAYNLANFPKAIEAFTKAYEISQAPGLLFNIAQSHRLNKDYEKASYFYSTYLRLKPDAPNRADVEARIKEMDDALAEQKRIAASPPTGTVNPDGNGATHPDAGNSGTPATGQNGTRPTTAPDTVTKTTGQLETPDTGQKDTGVTATVAPVAPKLISARFTGGLALLHSSDLGIPVQPSIGISGGYPLPVGPITLELGAGFSWTPLPYTTMEGQQQGHMLGVRAVVAAVKNVAPKLDVRGELGLGIISLGGLVQGNPIADMRQAESFTRPNFRFAVSADYMLTPNFAAYVSPFGIGISSASPQMYGGIREIDILVGVGYRQ